MRMRAAASVSDTKQPEAVLWNRVVKLGIEDACARLPDGSLRTNELCHAKKDALRWLFLPSYERHFVWSCEMADYDHVYLREHVRRYFARIAREQPRANA
jgi:hypothetical protein